MSDTDAHPAGDASGDIPSDAVDEPNVDPVQELWRLENDSRRACDGEG